MRVELATAIFLARIFLVLGLCEPACLAQQDDSMRADSDSQANAKLLFRSGFEGVSLSQPADGYQFITGTDSQSGCAWPPEVLGSRENGIHLIGDDDGKAIDNAIGLTTGPANETTNALFQRVKYDVGSTQTPYQLNYIKKNPERLYIRYRMKIDDTSLKGTDQWRAIWEYKTKGYAKNRGFRMIAFIATDLQGKIHWQFQGDRSPQRPIWNYVNDTIAVPREQWFRVEYFVRWSGTDDGYASMKVNGELIAEHSGPTTHLNKGLDFIMLTQVYGNSFPMHQWVDDIEIWEGIAD